jgi:type IV pilus assembly protein PilA
MIQKIRKLSKGFTLIELIILIAIIGIIAAVAIPNFRAYKKRHEQMQETKKEITTTQKSEVIEPKTKETKNENKEFKRL